jgi:outer membrane immunogenic protein
MKRIICSVFLILFIFASIQASAAGPANKWTGFYVGLQGSYDIGRSDLDWPLFGTHTDHNITGGMGGLVLGYNYQTPVNVVVGVETDFNAGKISGSSTCPNPADNCRTEVNWLGSTRARVGYGFSRVLPYFAVGVAYNRAELFVNNIATGTEVENTKNYYIGWTPAVGVEFAFTKNLIGRFEYAYYDFFKNSVTTSGIFIESIDNKINFQALKFALVWKF